MSKPTVFAKPASKTLPEDDMDTGAGGASVSAAANSEASFQELLEQLLAKYEGVVDQNRNLSHENGLLQAAAKCAKPEPAGWESPRRSPRNDNRRTYQSGASEWATDSRAVSQISRLVQSEDEAFELPSPPPVTATTLNSQSSGERAPLEVLGTWADSADQMVIRPKGRGMAKVSLRGIQSSLSSSEKFREMLGNAADATTVMSRCVLPPGSKKRLLWDSIGMLFLMFDIMHTPLMVFWERTSRFELIMAFMTTSFWTVDIGVSFFRGFNRACIVEMRPRFIAKHYLRREFVPDVIIVTLDWSLVVWEQSMATAVSYSRLGKAFRLVRIARILRLVRLVKITAFVDNLETHTTNASLTTIVHVLKSLLLIMAVNHFIACGWYAVGNARTPGWVDDFAPEHGILYKYATALHWSVTQFTPASMEVNPKNWGERLYAIATIFAGLVMFSSFVSTITSTMTTLRVEHQKRTRANETMRSFLAENNISVALGVRISLFLQNYKFSSPNRVVRSEVTLLKAMPKNLQYMLDWEIYTPVLLKHAYFYHCAEFSPSAMLMICHNVVQEVVIATCEELFHTGMCAAGKYITQTGDMQYFRGYDETSTFDINGRTKAAISECALWMKWVHQGRLFAMTACNFLLLSAPKLKKAFESFPELVPPSVTYAHLLRERLECFLESGELSSVSQKSEDYDGSSRLNMFDDLYSPDHSTTLELVQRAFESCEAMPTSLPMGYSPTLTRGIARLHRKPRTTRL